MAITPPAKQVALVTGASSGMGKETAKQLLKEGLVVYAAARRGIWPTNRWAFRKATPSSGLSEAGLASQLLLFGRGMLAVNPGYIEREHP